MGQRSGVFFRYKISKKKTRPRLSIKRHGLLQPSRTRTTTPNRRGRGARRAKKQNLRDLCDLCG